MICYCLQRSYKDTSNFDSVFTKETMKMTPTDSQLLMNVNKTLFSGFSYVNTKFVSKEWRCVCTTNNVVFMVYVLPAAFTLSYWCLCNFFHFVTFLYQDECFIAPFFSDSFKLSLLSSQCKSLVIFHHLFMLPTYVSSPVHARYIVKCSSHNILLFVDNKIICIVLWVLSYRGTKWCYADVARSKCTYTLYNVW